MCINIDIIIILTCHMKRAQVLSIYSGSIEWVDHGVNLFVYLKGSKVIRIRTFKFSHVKNQACEDE